MTTPISVLSRALRGSKLNEPTNTRCLSTIKVLACRLVPELPVSPRSLSLRFLSLLSALSS